VTDRSVGAPRKSGRGRTSAVPIERPVPSPVAARDRVRTGFGAAALVGAIGGLGRPGLDFAPAFFVSVAVLCAVASRRSLGRTVTYTAFWSLGVFGIVSLGAVSWGVAVPVGLTAIGCGLYALPLALWTHWASRRMPAIPLFVATFAGWTVFMEGADGLGYPLKCAATSLVAFAPGLLGGARLVGADAIEGLLTAGIVVTARPFDRLPGVSARAWATRIAAPAVASLAAVTALAGVAHAAARPAAGAIRVGVPQIDADSSYYESRMTNPAVVDAFAARIHGLLARLRDVDLLVLTETFDGRFDLQIPTVRHAWQSYAAAHHQAIVFTSYMVEANGWKSNAVGGFTPDGRWVGTHRKVDLAPYGERHLAAGGQYTPLPVLPDTSIGSVVCQESVLARPCRALAKAGAALLTVSTSDSTFGSSVIVFEHLAMAQLRAIEVGRAIVWASNAGPSALIDRWGALWDAAPFREPAAARFEAALFVDRTPFLGAAEVLPWLCAITWAVSVAATRGHPVDKGRSEPERRNVASLAFACAGQIAMLALAASLCAVSPALVEMVRGRPAQAAGAIGAIFARRVVTGSSDPFGRFRTGEPNTAVGALGYYLSYFGEEGTGVQAPEEPATLEALRAAVSSRLPSRIVPLSAQSLPRVATVFEWADGTFGVLVRPTGEGDAQIFSPVTGRTSTWPIDAWIRSARPEGLIPAFVRCDSPSDCPNGP
jgi:apolipoprotein N-acyltransferase